MNYIDLKYRRLVSIYLQGYKQTGNEVARFRCPFCGDSKKKKNKFRGYFYQVQGKCVFKCHNCGLSYPLFQFIQRISPTLAKDFIFQKFKKDQVKQTADQIQVTKTKTKFADKSILEEFPTIASLESEHDARSYLEGRLIPQKYFKELRYCDDVRKLANKIKGYQDRGFGKVPCIIIPFFDEDKDLSYLQVRFLSNSFIRYVTFEIKQNSEKIWGLDKIDWQKKVYVCEGPFDAMFIDNCLAVAGASIMSYSKYIQERAKSDFVLIFDKDYKTNPEVYGQFLKAVNQGIKVVMFDNRFIAKDINAQIEQGSIKDLQKYLEQRTFSGLGARLELTRFTPPKR